MYSLHVAVLVKRGKILAFANNKNGSRSSGSGYSERSIHAERHVVKRLGNIQELRGADMYIMRISKGGCRLQPSMPCPECQLFLEKCVREYGLRRIYFTA
jgi:hypothetical protein